MSPIDSLLLLLVLLAIVGALLLDSFKEADPEPITLKHSADPQEVKDYLRFIALMRRCTNS
jgi:hypothetical protein